MRPERVLAIDVAQQTVRGVVLTQGTPAIAGGYAQLDFDPAAGPVAFAVRIALALDVKAALPVAVTCDASTGDDAAKLIATAIAESGFRTVTVMPRDEADVLPAVTAADTETLDGVDIPSGLLTSHAGLTLSDLAGVVSAGLRLLDTDIDASAGAAHQPESADGWSPTSNAPPASESDPFTSGVSSATAAGVAATVAAAAAAAAFGDDDDLTVAAPAGRLTAPKPNQTPASIGEKDDSFASGDRDDITVPAPSRVAAADEEPEGGDPDLGGDTDLGGHTDFDEDATVNPDDMPAAAVAAAAGVAEDNIDETVMMDRAALREAAAVDTAAAGVEPSAAAEPSAAMAPSAAVAPRIASGDSEGGSKRMLLMLAAAVALVALIGLVVTQCGSSDGEPTSSASTTAGAADSSEESFDDSAADADDAAPPLAQPATEVLPAQVEPDPTALPELTPVPTATAEPTSTPEPEPTVDPLAGLPPLSTLPERGAIFRPPTLFLEGPVQTQEQADELYERAIAVVGPDNVVNNYVVRPDAPASLDGNVRVEQAVLFQTGSAAIADQFVPTLELGVAVMALNPQVQMVVEGHTDSVGSDAVNVALSQRRAESVVDYLVGRGVDTERLDAVGLGETTPVADNDTAEGRQINRRIEVNLLDLLAAE